MVTVANAMRLASGDQVGLMVAAFEAELRERKSLLVLDHATGVPTRVMYILRLRLEAAAGSGRFLVEQQEENVSGHFKEEPELMSTSLRTDELKTALRAAARHRSPEVASLGDVDVWCSRRQQQQENVGVGPMMM